MKKKKNAPFGAEQMLKMLLEYLLIGVCRTSTEKEAQECIEKGDRKRASYYNFYTFKKWGAATSYDVCLNTSLFGVERVADLIVNLLG